MKKDNSGYIALAAIGAYLLYQWYMKSKAVAPVAPGTPQTSLDQLSNTIQKSASSLTPTMSVSPSGSIVNEMMTVTAAPKVIPATYQTFYGESLSGYKVGKMPMTC